MDTKLKADIAESAVVTELLKRGFKVLKPIGDRLPYDLAVDVSGHLIKIQVKSSWFDKKSGNHICDVRRSKTNRRKMLRERYTNKDFDLAIIFIQSSNVFYIMPVEAFTKFGSTISLVETRKRQRLPASAKYREKWDLLSTP